MENSLLLLPSIADRPKRMNPSYATASFTYSLLSYAKRVSGQRHKQREIRRHPQGERNQLWYRYCTYFPFQLKFRKEHLGCWLLRNSLVFVFKQNCTGWFKCANSHSCHVVVLKCNKYKQPKKERKREKERNEKKERKKDKVRKRNK